MRKQKGGGRNHTTSWRRSNYSQFRHWRFSLYCKFFSFSQWASIPTVAIVTVVCTIRIVTGRRGLLNSFFCLIFSFCAVNNGRGHTFLGLIRELIEIWLSNTWEVLIRSRQAQTFSFFHSCSAGSSHRSRAYSRAHLHSVNSDLPPPMLPLLTRNPWCQVSEEQSWIEYVVKNYNFKLKIKQICAILSTEEDVFLANLERFNSKLLMAVCKEKTFVFVQGIDGLKTVVEDEE